MSDSQTASDPTVEKDGFEHAAAWRPEPGDIIRGTVTELAWGYSEYGEYPIVILQSNSGGESVAIHAFHTALRQRIEKLKPLSGDPLAVKFLGDVKSKDGKREYKGYLVKGRTAEQANFWATSAVRPDPITDDSSDDIPF